MPAGLACEGCKPVVAIYSTFLQRAYDQLIHDVTIQNLPLVLAIDRGGLVGADGATHNGSFDISYLRCLPNMTVMTPSDENECRQMLFTAFQLNTPAAVRYPRGAGPGAAIQQEMRALPIGKGEIRRRGKKLALLSKKIAILAFGSMVKPALEAAEELDATVANMRFVKPLDEALVAELARQPRPPGHGGGKRDHGRRRQRGARSIAETAHQSRGLAARAAGPFHRSRRPGAAA